MSRNGILKTPNRKHSPVSKDPIEVFCRVRPLRSNDEGCAEVISDTVVQINAPKNLKTVQSRIEQVQCTFTKVFTEDYSQKQIFEYVGLPLVQDLLTGKNGLCFMYGITGSGKTYTMNGEASNGGLLPRCLDSIFNSIRTFQTPRCVFKPDGYNGFEIISEADAKLDAEQKYAEIENLQRSADVCDAHRVPETTTIEVDEDNNYAIFVSFVEIYNNSVYDLLEDTQFDALKQPKPPSSKILREDQKRNMFVYEVTELEVKSTEEAFTLFWVGQNRRKTAQTLLNTDSSRSHCVFTIKLVQAPLGPNGDSIMKDPNLICVSQLSLCDLAGSERLSRTKNDGERVRQAGHINNSLMTLRSCIECLRENQKSQDSGNKMVPYRDSKLTHLFKNYFEGDGKVRMVVCLNPRIEDFDESLHVMRFSEMTQEVKVARSEGVKFDLGLTPGRGKANKNYKTMKIEDNLSSDTPSTEDSFLPLQQFPPWPLLEMTSFNDSTTLINLMRYLEDRIKLRRTLLDDNKQKDIELRQMIAQLEQDNFDLTKAMEEQRSLVTNERREHEKEVKTYEKRIRTVTQTFETQKKQLIADVEKYKESADKAKQEKAKMKQTLREITSNEKIRWERECDKRVRDKQLEMEGQVLMRNEKLRQLRDVVQNLQLPEENQIRLNQIISNERPIKNPRFSTVESHTLSSEQNQMYRTNARTEHQSSVDVHAKTVERPRKAPTVQPKPRHARNITASGSTPRSKTNVRSKSPPASLTAGRKNDVAPVRGRRRSRSSDFWLNHKPKETLGTDTVMQPIIRNKKTVKNPNMKDLKTFPNYILTHQEEDSAGEIETRLIKGEMMKTRGGGTSVQFTDMETLKKSLEDKAGQKRVATENSKPERLSKTSRSHSKSHSKKRKSEENLPPDSEDSWTSVETRCAVGIEGKPGAEPGLTHHSKKLKS